MIISNKNMVTSGVTMARLEETKDKGVLIHLYPSRSTYSKIPANSLTTARETIKELTKALLEEKQAQINKVKIENHIILDDNGAVLLKNTISKTK